MDNTQKIIVMHGFSSEEAVAAMRAIKTALPGAQDAAFAMQSFGWAATKFNMWTETAVLLPVGIVTLLLCVFVVPRFLPDKPEFPTSMASNWSASAR